MSVQTMSVVWGMDLPANLKFVLLAMADHANEDGEGMCPSAGRIAHKCGLSDRQVRRIIEQLIARGLLRETGVHPKYQTKTYTLNYAAADSLNDFSGGRGRPRKGDAAELSAGKNHCQNDSGQIVRGNEKPLTSTTKTPDICATNTVADVTLTISRTISEPAAATRAPRRPAPVPVSAAAAVGAKRTAPKIPTDCALADLTDEQTKYLVENEPEVYIEWFRRDYADNAVLMKQLQRKMASADRSPCAYAAPWARDRVVDHRRAIAAPNRTSFISAHEDDVPADAAEWLQRQRARSAGTVATPQAVRP